MNKFYVIDYFSKKYYGPFKNCKKAKQACRFIRDYDVPDVMVEIGTNVVVTDDFDIIPANFQESSFEELKSNYVDKRFVGGEYGISENASFEVNHQ